MGKRKDKLSRPSKAVNRLTTVPIGKPVGYHVSVSPLELTNYIRQFAAEVGFDRCGIARAEPIGREAYFRAWLEAGRAGSMAYLHRYVHHRTDPRVLLPGAKSVVVTALLYHQPEPPPPAVTDGPTGRVAMYAWGDDYHTVIKQKLFAIADALREELDEPFEAKACVDTAPLLEREMAAAAGVGWIGKNTMAIDPDLGSYFFLGALVTTLELVPDQSIPDHCGTCTRCLDACPTKAFPAPYEMDASRCISYLTIEHRDEIAAEFHGPMQDWIFGCDVCQEVCPFNRDPATARESSFRARSPGARPSLDELAGWTPEDYRAALKGSAMKRAKLDMLKRNVDIALNNARGR